MVCILGYFVFREDPALAISNTRLYICSETLEVFENRVREGETIPVQSPHSGKATGYPVEKCFWTAEGKAKAEPTYVLMNEYVEKEGPTICPDCGRRVNFYNRRPPAELMREAESAE